MTKRIIGVCNLPFNKIQNQRMHNTAAKYGFTVKQFNAGQFNASVLSKCEVMCGDFPTEVIANATALRWFHSDWAGVEEYVNHPSFSKHQITLTNSSGAYGTMIAEYLLMGALMLLRRAPDYLKSQQLHIWCDALPASAFYDKRVTVIGTGNTGSSFAKLAKALGAHVIGCNTSGANELECYEMIYSTSQIDKALKDAEIVAICLPSTAATEGLIGSQQLSQLSPGALLLNSGRGSTLDIDALVEALQNGHLGGAMLDVFTNEPLDVSSPLWDVPNLIITPHISGLGSDLFNAEQVLKIFCDNIQRYAENEQLHNIVDLDRGY